MPAPAQGNTHSRASKSLYTPVFYDDVPDSNVSSTGEVGTCSSYLKRLTREHLARASMEEVESSVAGSPTSESKARVGQLVAKVERVYAEANGNPADGRWVFVSDLLRLRCTRGGRRWLGANLDARAPEIPKHLCVIPKTNEEWQELECRIKDEEDVNSKVQRWIRTAEFEPLTPDVTVDRDQDQADATSPLNASNPRAEPSGRRAHAANAQTNLKSSFSLSHPLSSGSRFGFNVVKRSNTALKDSLKSRYPPPSVPSPNPTNPAHVHEPLPPTLHNAEVPDQSSQPPLHPPRDIANRSDSNFIQPSFRLSQIQTSTPLLIIADQVQKPDLPRKSSLEALESFDPRHSPESAHLGDNPGFLNRKRGRSGSPEEPVAKKIKTVVEVDQLSTPPPQLDAAEALATPPVIKALPHLTELLALSPRNKRSSPRKHNSNSPAALPAPARASDSGNHKPSAIPELPQAKRADTVLSVNGNPIQTAPVPEPPFQAPASEIPLAQIPDSIAAMVDDGDSEGSQVPEPTAELQPEADDDTSTVEAALIVQRSQRQTSDPPSSPKADPFRFPSIGPESVASKLEATTYNLYGLDNLDSSPAKSLSSLAGSDSELDDDEVDDRTSENISSTVPKRLHHLVDPEFNPQFTSTQKSNLDYNLASNAVFNGPTTSDNLSWGNEKLPSTSQLQAEVNSQVDEFDKFMEADLGYDLVAPGL